MTVCEVDLRPGGASRLAWRGPDGEVMEIRGEYREVVPPERIVATESWGADWPETLNTIVFAEGGGRTTVTITVLYPTTESRDAALRTGMEYALANPTDNTGIVNAVKNATSLAIAVPTPSTAPCSSSGTCMTITATYTWSGLFTHMQYIGSFVPPNISATLVVRIS